MRTYARAGAGPATMAGKMVEVGGVEPPSELVPLGVLASRITVYTPVGQALTPERRASPVPR